MTSEQHDQVEQLFHAAILLPAAERAALLARDRVDDAEVRRAVERLLDGHERAEGFLDAPVWAALAPQPEPAGQMIGRRLDHYQIISLLGKGGMGEVYLARDTRLERQAALKLLPLEFMQDAERVRRFEREAKTASALSHPNILTIYEFSEVEGLHFIATEFVAGGTLRERMNETRLSLAEALDLAVQMASALSAAHEAGIVHRDFKPENVMVRPDGLIKVLDFGLAKLIEDRAPRTDITLPPAHTTEPGRVLGTISYLSPEQARGQRLDARTDIFSFGVVLYEMLARRRPFTGASANDVIAEILKTEPPPLSHYTPGIPGELAHIVGKALRKDREQRYQTARELLSDLKRLKRELEFAEEFRATRVGNSDEVTVAAIAPPGAAPAPRLAAAGAPATRSGVAPSKSRWRGIGLTMLACAALGAGLVYSSAGFRAWRQRLTAAPNSTPRILPFTSFAGHEIQPAFSPDGNQIAFAWEGEAGDNWDIYVKQVGADGLLRLTTGPAADTKPVWSPDGRYITFLRKLDDGMAVFSTPFLGGGAERRLTATRYSAVQSLGWAPDGQSLVLSAKSAPLDPYGLLLLRPERGETQRLTAPPQGSMGDYDAAFTDGKSVPVTAIGSTGDLDAAFSPDGKTLVFTRARANVADIYLLPATGGEPQRLTFDDVIAANPSWSPDGREIFFVSNRGGGRTVWRVPVAGGTPIHVDGIGQDVSSLTVARQTSRIAYARFTGDVNLWRIELAAPRPTPVRLAYSTQNDLSPQYSPDGRRLVFASDRSGSYELWVSDRDGRQPVRLTFFNGPTTGSPQWSPDGEQIVLDSRVGGNADLFVISAAGGAAQRLTTDPAEEIAPSWSRDGRWIYFCSNRDGQTNIWKMPARGGPAVQVTQQGGFECVEAFDGRQLYFIKGRGVPGIWRLPLSGGAEELVTAHHRAGFWRHWAVTAQGLYFATAETTEHPIIEFFSFATGQTRLIARMENSIPRGTSGLAVSPDERSLCYAQNDQDQSDIVLIENFH